MARQVLRRDFLKTSAAVSTGAIFSTGVFGNSGRVRAASPNGKLRTAHIGVGGMGGGDLGQIAGHKQVEVAAICDVDAKTLEGAAGRHPGAKTFRDFREMISSLGDKIDAVVISTPDHTHAPAAMTALNAGKPVYCQKPLTHEVFEARKLREVAESKKLVTQMGIQVHSSEIYRRASAMIQAGVIGKVSQVHAWSSKNWGYDGGPLKTGAAVPETLDWNLWLGTAPQREFAAGLHPGGWRKFIDYGTGTLGDMGVHIFDTPYDALALTFPKWAKTTCRTPTGVGHPEKNIVEYEFPATKYTAESLSWKWYDGSFAPPSLAELNLPASAKVPADFKLPGQASLFVGEGGVMLLPHVAAPILFPETKFADYQPPKVAGANHYHQWVDACLGNGKTSADFSYAGPLTEALLLGVVANRFPETKLEWDAAKLTVTNLPDANKLITRKYRKGFEVAGLA